MKEEWRIRNLTAAHVEKTDANGKQKNERQCQKVNRKRKSRDENNKEKIPKRKMMANERVRGKSGEEMPRYKEIVALADLLRKLHILYFERIELRCLLFKSKNKRATM